MHKTALNPFTYGTIALDAAFTDREEELAELERDLENGQDVVVFAPRRYGKSSLVLRAAQRAVRSGGLVAYCDLMRTPTKEQFAAALARTIHEDLSSPADRTAEAAVRLFRGLRVEPSIELGSDGTVRFAFHPTRRRAQIDETIERLLELPAEIAAERKRRVVLVFDEFQEVTALDPHFPNLMRAIFQLQPEVAHVYLGSKRHLIDRIFSDRNAAFWRSARRVELGPIPRRKCVVRQAALRPVGAGDHARGPRPSARHHARAPVRHPGARALRVGARPGGAVRLRGGRRGRTRA